MEDIYISKKRRQSDEFDFVFLNETPPPPQEEKPKEKKKKHRFLKFIATLLIVAFLFSSVFIFVFAAASGYTRNDLDMWANCVARMLNAIGITEKSIDGRFFTHEFVRCPNSQTLAMHEGLV